MKDSDEIADLLRAKETLAQQSEWLRVTLASIGDAVVTADTEGKVLSLNTMAESLTGWKNQEALGHPLSEAFHIINEDTREPVSNPAERALKEGRIVGLANHTLLVARDGTETPIDDSAAPIRDESGQIRGVVLIFRSIAERRQAERALRKSERELADFFENASEGLHLLGPDGIILRANRAELQMLGYSRDEYVGHHIAEFHADPELYADMLRRLVSGETLRDCAVRMRCKDGSLKDVLVDSSVHWEDGRFVHTRCFTRDITDRKKAAEAQARLAAIVESSQDAIIGKTLEGRIVSWNVGAEQIFGYTAQEMLGQSITRLIPWERHDEERLILERLRRGQRIENYETVRVTKQGRHIDVDLTISPIRDNSGRVIGASKISRDITARKRAEQRLAAQYAVTQILALSASLEEAAPKILEALGQRLGWPVGVLWTVDKPARTLACREVYCQPGVEVAKFADSTRKLAMPCGIGLPGRVWQDGKAVGISDVIRDPNYVRAAIASAENLHGAFGFPIKLGGEVLGVVELYCQEIRTPEPELLEMMMSVGSQIGQFIERKRAEEALKESDRRKDEFLAILAHELRNPLAPIRNAVQILRAKGPPIPELSWAREMIDRQLDQLTRLVDDLLDVSRITRGKIDLRKQWVELRPVVNIAVEASRPLIEQHEQSLSVEIPSEPIVLEADPTRLAQALLNLLNNAAKYTESGGRIWLTVKREGNRAVIRVKDTGVGIPPDMLHRIFDMFTQVDRSIERSQGGLGIGLTLAQRLIAMHGGQVTAQSAGPGKGSEFIVNLPAAESDRGASPGSDKIDTPPSVRPLRILVVDDNRDASESLAMFLELLGHEVRIAFDGQAAVEAAAAFQPTVVLLDIGLPKLNGYEAARRIKASRGDSVVLIALTGWGQDADRRRSKEAGFQHHLTKPVEPEDLTRLLAEVKLPAAQSTGQA